MNGNLAKKGTATSRKRHWVTSGLFMLTILLAAMSHCAFEYEYSPYCTNTGHKNLNRVNIDKITEISRSKGITGEFRIGLISDIHHYYSETKDAIRILNERGDLNFVIILGDTTNTGLLREYEWSYDVIRYLRYPFVVLIGNHDCLSYGIDIFREMYGPFNFTFTFMDTDFICFNNNNWESGEPDYGWLEKTAEESTAPRKILLSHIDNSGSAFGRFSESQIQRFNRIVADYFDCAIHGHAHEDSCEKIVDGVPRYQIGSTGYGHYMIVTLTPGHIEVERCVF